MAPLLLDLFCCQGGVSAGYVKAGFEVVGVDITAQPRYPFTFFKADALELLEALLDSGDVARFAAVHASPPCQGYGQSKYIRGNEHPDLIGPTRDLLIRSGLPFIIENVPKAPLIDPVTLCGQTFGLHTYRHRLFESNVELTAPEHLPHVAKQVKLGRALKEGDFYQAVGNFISVDYVRQDLDVAWMNREGIRECVPPAYTEHLGKQLITRV